MNVHVIKSVPERFNDYFFIRWVSFLVKLRSKKKVCWVLLSNINRCSERVIKWWSLIDMKWWSISNGVGFSPIKAFVRPFLDLNSKVTSSVVETTFHNTYYYCELLLSWYQNRKYLRLLITDASAQYFGTLNRYHCYL